MIVRFDPFCFFFLGFVSTIMIESSKDIIASRILNFRFHMILKHLCMPCIIDYKINGTALFPQSIFIKTIFKQMKTWALPY